MLHVDKNDYYGGDEAALSLQEVAAWVEAVNDASSPSSFRNAVLSVPDSHEGSTKLGFSRAYSISLSPHLIYARSNLLPALVSSKVYRQLEFLAVVSWWVYSEDNDGEKNDVGNAPANSSDCSTGRLSKIPGGREDVFKDKSIDLRTTRSLMKFLRLAADPETHASFLNEWGPLPFSQTLASHFKIPPDMQSPIVALTSSPDPPSKTTTSFAITRIHRHLTSIGMFGPGFGSVIPKWGGLAEISQVACRAGAVGGGIYMLKNGIERVDFHKHQDANEVRPLCIHLQGGEELLSDWLVGTHDDLPQHPQAPSPRIAEVSRSITIVSSPLSALFPLSAEGAPSPAGAVIVFPTGSIKQVLESQTEDPPVYLLVHSSDTGECPNGQSVIYASTSLPNPTSSTLLARSVQKFLATVDEDPKPEILWTLHYTQYYTISSAATNSSIDEVSSSPIICLPDVPPDMPVEDSVLDNVKQAWEKIVSTVTEEDFLIFEDREVMGEDEEDDQVESV